MGLNLFKHEAKKGFGAELDTKLDANKLYLIAGAVLVLILLLSLSFMVSSKQPAVNPEKEKAKKVLIEKLCGDKRLTGMSLFECDNGFYSKESCTDCLDCYYNISGNLTKCCGGFSGDCKVYQAVEIANCTKQDLCT